MGRRRPRPFGEGKDASGHEHDPHSGEFTGSGGGGGGKAARVQVRREAHRTAGREARHAEGLWDKHQPLPKDHPHYESIRTHLGNATLASWNASNSDLAYRHEELVRAREGVKQALVDGGLGERSVKVLQAMLPRLEAASVALLKAKKETHAAHKPPEQGPA